MCKKRTHLTREKLFGHILTAQVSSRNVDYCFRKADDSNTGQHDVTGERRDQQGTITWPDKLTQTYMVAAVSAIIVS